MSEDEIKSICSVLVAIYHLGVAGAVKGKAGGNTGPRSITPWKWFKCRRMRSSQYVLS